MTYAGTMAIHRYLPSTTRIYATERGSDATRLRFPSERGDARWSRAETAVVTKKKKVVKKKTKTVRPPSQWF